MLRTLRERVEAGVTRSPACEAFHDRLEKAAPDGAVPEVGADGERTEEADAAPVRREDGAGELPVDVRRERRARVGAPAGGDPVAVTGERRRVGHADERPERHAEGSRLIALRNRYDRLRSIETVAALRSTRSIRSKYLSIILSSSFSFVHQSTLQGLAPPMAENRRHRARSHRAEGLVSLPRKTG